MCGIFMIDVIGAENWWNIELILDFLGTYDKWYNMMLFRRFLFWKASLCLTPWSQFDATLEQLSQQKLFRNMPNMRPPICILSLHSVQKRSKIPNCIEFDCDNRRQCIQFIINQLRSLYFVKMCQALMYFAPALWLCKLIHKYSISFRCIMARHGARHISLFFPQNRLLPPQCGSFIDRAFQAYIVRYWCYTVWTWFKWNEFGKYVKYKYI